MRFRSTIALPALPAELLRQRFLSEIGYTPDTPLGDIFTDYGWDFEERGDGSFVDLYPQELSRTGPQDWLEFCTLIAPFVEDGSALEYLDDGWSRFRFFFSNKQVCHQEAVFTYENQPLR